MAISMWFRQLDTSRWTDRARCARYQHLPWYDDATPMPDKQAEMAAVCRDCPVITNCASYALSGNVGGFHAGVWVPWNTESRNNKALRRHAFHMLRKTVARTQAIPAAR